SLLPRKPNARRLRMSDNLHQFVTYMSGQRRPLVDAMRNTQAYQQQFEETDALGGQQLGVGPELGRPYTEAINVINELYVRIVQALDRADANYSNIDGYYPLASADIEQAVAAGLLPTVYSPKAVGYREQYITPAYYEALCEYCLATRSDLETAHRIVASLTRQGQGDPFKLLDLTLRINDQEGSRLGGRLRFVRPLGLQIERLLLNSFLGKWGWITSGSYDRWGVVLVEGLLVLGIGFG